MEVVIRDMPLLNCMFMSFIMSFILLISNREVLLRVLGLHGPHLSSVRGMLVRNNAEALVGLVEACRFHSGVPLRPQVDNSTLCQESTFCGAVLFSEHRFDHLL